MKKGRNIFQANLRKDVEIKPYIASCFYENVVQKLTQEIQNFATNIAKELEENEK